MELPLHYGNAPSWLFSRMVALSRAIYTAIEKEYSRDEFLRRISNPFWFQCFACALGFDFHSSGTTTVTCGALKEALSMEENGISFFGGKGKSSRNVKEELYLLAEKNNFSESKINNLIYISKITAKVDSSLIQDGYQLYHHSLIVTESGNWAVIQQGMNPGTKYARRYHWFWEDAANFTIEPHTAICCDRISNCLNLTARESEDSRKSIVDLVKESPYRLARKLSDPKQTTLFECDFVMQQRHEIDVRLYRNLLNLNEFNPRNFEEIVAYPGVGPKTIRALAMLSKLIYGTEPSWRDPVKYSFTVGGKDGFPYPVDKKIYEEAIEFISDAVSNSNMDRGEKLRVMKKLNIFYSKL
ncbi:MAG: DUF763 domain-containing protein [Candidatus Micrarchaeota archaeon]|nr:DUF763 domain-containing protein [Candidatus Micrarchaeota archaeon]